MRRKVAHIELLRRSDIPEAAVLERFDRAALGSVERPTLLWLVALKASEPATRERLTRALADPDAMTRLQAVRAFTQRLPGTARDTAALLADPNPQVRHAAVVAFFDARGLLEQDDALRDKILAGPASESDTYYREHPILDTRPQCVGAADALSTDVRLGPRGRDSLHVRFASPSWLRLLP